MVAQQLIPTPDGKSRRVCVEVMLGTPLVQDYIRKGEVPADLTTNILTLAVGGFARAPLK